MILHFLCTLLFLTTIGCYSVNEEEAEAENPPKFDVAASSKHEKALKVTSRRADVPTLREDENKSGSLNGHFSDIDEASPYDDATPLKVVKYKNYGYFNPTLKLSPKAAPLAAAVNAASPAAFQFQSGRNLASLMAHNGNTSRPIFHFQRRADEDRFELEEIEDSVNVRDRQVKSNAHVPNHRSFYPTLNDSQILKLQQTPHHNRRVYHRAYPVNSIESSSHTVDSETKSTPELHEDDDIDFESLFNEHYGIKGLSEKKDKVDRPVKVKPADSEREALIGSQREYVDISSESEESNRAASDVDLDREYRKLSFASTKERSRKVERSLADPEPEATLSGFFVPTPIPGYLYPKSEEVVDNTTIQVEKKDETSKTKIQGSSTTESVSQSTYFLPTRPASTSEEVQSITYGLSSFYTVGNVSEISSKRPPIVFVTAPVQNEPFVPDNIATVEEEISEKKNFSIEDFYNAFSANVTEYPNRHRDDSSSGVNAASTGSFLALAPHFPSSLVSDSESSRAIKYPCTCDKGKCGCCTGRIMSNFNVNIPARGCLNITYIPEDFEFLVKMTYNDRTLAQRRVSGKNPRPMCVPLPRLTGRAQACVKLSNVYLVGRNVHMCLDLEAKIQNEELFKVSFDCVRMGTSGIKWIKPEDGGDLPPPPVVEGPAPDDYDTVVASEGDEITDAKSKKKNGVKKMGNSTKTADVTKTGNLTRVSTRNPVKSGAGSKNVQNSLEDAKHAVKDEKQKKTGGKRKQGNNKGSEGKRSHKEEEEEDDEYDYE